MTTTRIYHNPRCSKSRQTLELLRENGVEPEIVEYLAATPNADELRRVADMLGVAPAAFARKKECAEAGIDPESVSAEDLFAAMAANPAIIERPIVVHGDRAVLGRPPENVLDLLKH